MEMASVASACKLMNNVDTKIVLMIMMMRA